MAIIAFIHAMDQDNEQRWLLRLNQLLADNTEAYVEGVSDIVVSANDLSNEQAATVELAIVANPDVDELARFSRLIWVQSLWAGVEAMVPKFAGINRQRAGHEIKLVRLIDPFLAQTMAEAVLAWTLFLHRNMAQYAAQQQKKIWRELPCDPASEIRVSILGAGELGRAAIDVLLHMGYQVNSWSRSAKDISGVGNYSGAEGLTELLTTTDILVCLLPLTEQTKHIINKQTLNLLPRGAKIINFARGGIINHTDLLEALDNAHIEHAVLDVFEQEPLIADSPLWSHPHISVLPHISATTNLATASRVAIDNIINYRQYGAIPASVDLQRGY